MALTTITATNIGANAVTGSSAAVSFANTLGVTGVATFANSVIINSPNTKISSTTNHLILHDTAESDVGANWWYMYRVNGDGALRFYRNVDRVTISSGGIVITPYQPSFRATRTAGTLGSSTDIIFNSVDHNVGSHYNSTTGKFTAPVAGSYLFTFAGISTNATSNFVVQFYKNGTATGISSYNFGITNYTNLAMSTIFSLAANDTIHLVGNNVYAAGDGGNPRFAGYLLG